MLPAEHGLFELHQLVGIEHLAIVRHQAVGDVVRIHVVDGFARQFFAWDAQQLFVGLIDQDVPTLPVLQVDDRGRGIENQLQPSLAFLPGPFGMRRSVILNMKPHSSGGPSVLEIRLAMSRHPNRTAVGRDQSVFQAALGRIAGVITAERCRGRRPARSRDRRGAVGRPKNSARTRLRPESPATAHPVARRTLPGRP